MKRPFRRIITALPIAALLPHRHLSGLFTFCPLICIVTAASIAIIDTESATSSHHGLPPPA